MKYSCPFCQQEFDAFNPFGHTAQVLRELEVIGGGGRKNALCPRCGSLDRERLVYLYLQDKPLAGRLLHVAPAPRLAKFLRGKFGDGYVIGRFDLTDAPFTDDSFDAIVCNHVLEHIENDRKAMVELYRVLKPGGWAILQVPVSWVLQETLEDSTVHTPEERYRAFGQRDHVRVYAHRDYVRRLKDAGFAVTLYYAMAELGAQTVARYGLNPQELLYIGRKE